MPRIKSRFRSALVYPWDPWFLLRDRAYFLLPVYLIWLLAAGLILGCNQVKHPAVKQPAAPAERPSLPTTLPTTPASQPGEAASGPFRFADVAQSLGVRFRHYAPLTPQRHIHLFMGSGI